LPTTEISHQTRIWRYAGALEGASVEFIDEPWDAAEEAAAEEKNVAETRETNLFWSPASQQPPVGLSA
jgi:hypothetical protein